MYDILKNRIHTGGFKLLDIQSRAKKLYAMGELTDEQLDELMALSQQNAAPEAERPETLAMILALAERVSALEKNQTAQDNTEEDQTEYEEWEQPVAGLTDKYQPGAIVFHKGKLWKSTCPKQNTWEPGIPGTESLWVEYVEEAIENV